MGFQTVTITTNGYSFFNGYGVVVPHRRFQIDPNAVVELFMAASLVQETTAFLLEALKNNKKEEGYLQTKLLEINLLGGSPQVRRMGSLLFDPVSTREDDVQ